MKKYLVVFYKTDVVVAYIDAETPEEALSIANDEEKSKDIPWLFLPTSEWVQVNKREDDE